MTGAIISSTLLPLKTKAKEFSHALSASAKTYTIDPLKSTWGNMYGAKYSLEKSYNNIRPKITLEKFHKESPVGGMKPTTNVYGISAGVDVQLRPDKKINPYLGIDIDFKKAFYDFTVGEEKMTYDYNCKGASLRAGIETKLTEKSKLFIEAQTSLLETQNETDIVPMNNNSISLGIRF